MPTSTWYLEHQYLSDGMSWRRERKGIGAGVTRHHRADERRRRRKGEKEKRERVSVRGVSVWNEPVDLPPPIRERRQKYLGERGTWKKTDGGNFL